MLAEGSKTVAKGPGDKSTISEPEAPTTKATPEVGRVNETVMSKTVMCHVILPLCHVINHRRHRRRPYFPFSVRAEG